MELLKKTMFMLTLVWLCVWIINRNSHLGMEVACVCREARSINNINSEYMCYITKMTVDRQFIGLAFGESKTIQFETSPSCGVRDHLIVLINSHPSIFYEEVVYLLDLTTRATFYVDNWQIGTYYAANTQDTHHQWGGISDKCFHSYRLIRIWA